MVKKRCVLALVLVLCMMLTATVQAGGGHVLYDEDGGETLGDLLDEDASVWPTVAAPADPDTLAVEAKGAVLMDQDSGQVLYEKDAYAKLPIASVTKVMTLLLVMEALEEGRLKWTDTVTCSERAASMGGSQIWLEPGEIMTVEELVKAAAVVSANDACAALAEQISGSIDGFVAAMNQRAVELGMENTLFKDCSGLDDSGYSCAYDVAVMSRELMTHRDIERFTTIWMDTLRGGESQLVNTNKLVRHYHGATGLKTGTTAAAGHCLAATARREETAFVAVVLGCDTTAKRWEGARQMLDYGFGRYVSYLPPIEEMVTDSVKVLGGQQPAVDTVADPPTRLLLKKGSEQQVTMAVEMASDLEAPVLKGQTVGFWRVMLGEEMLTEIPIRTACDVPAVTLRWAYGLLLEALLA